MTKTLANALEKICVFLCLVLFLLFVIFILSIIVNDIPWMAIITWLKSFWDIPWFSELAALVCVVLFWAIAMLGLFLEYLKKGM